MAIWQITSVKALREWLRLRRAPQASFFARGAPGWSKRLLVSSEPTVEIEWDLETRKTWRLHPIVLPSVEEAREWWFRIWEDEIVEYYYAPRSQVACVAKRGTWRSLSPWGMMGHKDDFELLAKDKLKRLIGQRQFSQMEEEEIWMGISVRRINSPH